jgi:HlyD family secretion protein
MVRLGVSNYDFTEVLSGLEEGEEVALLSAAALQMRRQEMQDRMRGMGGVPGMQRQGTGAPAGGAAGGQRGGGR